MIQGTRGRFCCLLVPGGKAFSWTYTWQQGRQLATMSDGETSWTYTYNANGIRLDRTNSTDAEGKQL